ncbi:hypothetical protein TWF481_009187 [Arthrobotrys musiformis]|uniref:BTB domain-containing protein n=1 Tax=Arthrobotrys musiformis TaxID=47236 RepID=A0AAV9W301_9PEZI
MEFTAPLYIPGETDLTLLIGPEEVEFEANYNILASQSKFFEVACHKHFKEGQERVIRLPDPEVEVDVMVQVLEWLYRTEVEIPKDFMDDGPAENILKVLHLADFLQIDGLIKEYSQKIGRALRQSPTPTYQWAHNGTRLQNLVSILNTTYQLGGSTLRDDLAVYVKKLKTNKVVGALTDAASSIEDPNGKFLQDLLYAVLKWNPLECQNQSTSRDRMR